MASSEQPPARRYQVRILYREPGYAARTCPRLHPYQGLFEVVARSESGAVVAAVEEFEAIARRSSVGWVREIERIECTALPPRDLPPDNAVASDLDHTKGGEK